MNCKPGDIAIVVRSIAGNDGKIVQCLRLATDAEVRETHMSQRLSPYWVIDRSLSTRWFKSGLLDSPKRLASDSILRPITPPAGTITTEEVNTLYAPSAPEKVGV